MKNLTARSNLLTICLLLSISPLLVLQGLAMANQPYLYYSPIAWLMLANYLWRTQRVGFAYDPLRRMCGTLLFFLGLVSALVAAVFISPNIAQFSLFATLTGWILVQYGIVPWTRLAMATLFLWVTWPLPLGIVPRMDGWLVAAAVDTCSHILDLAGVSHFLLPGNFLDLRAIRVELDQISPGWVSLALVFFFSQCVLFYSRRRFLIGLATFAVGPLIYFTIFSVYFLFQVWMVEQFSSADFLSGWLLWASHVVLASLGLLLVWSAAKGFTYVFDPVPVDTVDRGKNGVHTAYNIVTSWPMNFIADTENDSQAYLDEETQDEETPNTPQVQFRKLPKYPATVEATDPWDDSRFFVPSLVTCAAVLLLSSLAWLIPERSKPERSDFVQIDPQEIVGINPFPNAGTTNTRSVGVSSNDDGLTSLNWEYDDGENVGVLAVIYPQRGLPAVWRVLLDNGYQLDGVVGQLDVKTAGNQTWPVFRVRLIDSIGRFAYVWTTALDSSGAPYAPGRSLFASFQRRLSTSIFGRLLGSNEVPETVQLQLVIESSRNISERQLGAIDRQMAVGAQMIADAILTK